MSNTTLDDRPSADETDEGTQRRGPDLVTRVLTIAVALTIAIVLGVLGYLLYYGLTPRTPRTLTELRIQTLEGVTKQNPKDLDSWAQYVRSLVAAGQYAQAGSALADARSNVGQKAALTVEEGRMLSAQGRLDDAIKVLDEAVGQAQAERKAAQDALAKGEVREKITSQQLNDAEVLLGDIYVKQQQFAKAIAAYTTALGEDPNMADVLVSRGNAYLGVKRYAAARSDFQTAVKFIPGYKPALDGLAKLKAVGQ